MSGSLATHDRALGAYLGLACGDALGATVEFLSPAEIHRRHGVHREITGGGWLNLRRGQVTDDTEMSLALGRAIVESGGWDAHAAARAFVGWLRDSPADVGNTCQRGILRYLREGSLEGPVNPGDGGNGACMRNLPVVLATLHDAGLYRRATLEQCHLTHNHPLSDAGTLGLGWMLRRLLAGEGLGACRQESDALVAAHPEFCYLPYPGNAGGYIVDTLQTVLHCFYTTDSFEDCVVQTVNRGGDADTTGALAGMLAGAHYGAAAIPERWLARLDRAVLDEIGRQTAALLALGTDVR